MEEVETKDDAVVESGFRPRSVFFGRGVLDRHGVIGNFAVTFEDDAKTCEYAVSVKCRVPFKDITTLSVGKNFQPWCVEFMLTSTNETGEELHKKSILLNNNSPTTCLNVSKFLTGHAVKIEYTKIDGLNVLPLRDYSVPTEMSDITLVIEEKPFRLYKGFLASNSPVFAKMLFGEFAEKNKDVIELKEVSAEAFTDMLDFLTHDVHHVHNKASLLAVLSLADRFDVAAVFPKVEHSLLIAPETVRLNAGKMLCIADKYKMATLLSHCLSRWENSKASTLTNKMHADLSSGTSYALFLNLSAQPSAK